MQNKYIKDSIKKNEKKTAQLSTHNKTYTTPKQISYKWANSKCFGHKPEEISKAFLPFLGGTGAMAVITL